jgi:hypothetical protein
MCSDAPRHLIGPAQEKQYLGDQMQEAHMRGCMLVLVAGHPGSLALTCDMMGWNEEGAAVADV